MICGSGVWRWEVSEGGDVWRWVMSGGGDVWRWIMSGGGRYVEVCVVSDCQ